MNCAESPRNGGECGSLSGLKLHKTDGPGGATNSVIPALPPSIRRFHMTTPLPGDSPRPVGPRAIDLTPEMVAPMLSRFYAYHVQGAPDACWEWQGTVNQRYGSLGRSARGPLKNVLAHRIAWVAVTGTPLSDGTTVDHLCRNTVCVNYHHLEAVSLAENVRRAWSDRTPTVRESLLAEMVEASPLVDGRGHGNRLRRACSGCGIAFTSDYLRKHIARIHLRGDV